MTGNECTNCNETVDLLTLTNGANYCLRCYEDDGIYVQATLTTGAALMAQANTDKLMDNTTQFLKEYYGQLDGLMNFKFNGVSDDGFPQFTITHHKNRLIYELELSSDEEGNNGGFMFINVPDEKSYETKGVMPRFKGKQGES